jgi:RNA 3'-terminal phosphate cyclase (ATP)
MIIIDGSHNEGGGQIFRTALTLSLETRTPFRIEKIRASRKRPGLLRQHLTAVQAAAQIGHAEVEGDQINSQGCSFLRERLFPESIDFPLVQPVARPWSCKRSCRFSCLLRSRVF